jgi:hypothetical protein
MYWSQVLLLGKNTVLIVVKPGITMWFPESVGPESWGPIEKGSVFMEMIFQQQRR